MRADLQVTWLVSAVTDPGVPVRAARFCQACAPTGRVSEIVCAVCGDGPLVAGDIPTTALLDWLVEQGWRAPAIPTDDFRQSSKCPQCVGRQRARRG